MYLVLIPRLLLNTCALLIMLVALLPLLFASSILATPLARQNTRQYNIYNKCPTAIDLYISGTNHGTIPTGGSVSRTLGTSAGYFFTDANGGSKNINRAIYAGFYEDFYYIVSGPEHANTGLQVKPKNRTANNGFCETIQCDDLGCPQGFWDEPPKRFPDPMSTMPSPPYYRCNYPNTDYDITFCPTGQFPDRGQSIRFDHTLDKCLSVQQGAAFANGTPVQIYQCNGSDRQRWMIQRGSTKVRLAKTNFCLDAGANPANGVQLKLWECYDNLPAQQWYYTDDNRIALGGQGFCMDLDNGILTSTYKVQTWMCSNNNNNQVWTL